MEYQYRIADIVVKMNSFGTTIERAKPYLIEPQENVDIVIQSDWKKIKEKNPRLTDDVAEYLCTGMNFYTDLLKYNGLMIHASAIYMDGRAYLFSANAGTGKSTHTDLWQQVFGTEKVRFLNDDKPAIRLEEGKWYAYGTPWSGKYELNANIRVPLAGIAMIERDDNNSIEPFSGPQAILALLRQTTKAPDAASKAKVLELLDKLIADIPIWRLRCNMSPEAALVSYEAMSKAGKE